VTRLRLALAALVAAIALASGCGGERSARVEIRFWNGFAGPDGTTMLAIVKRFNREHSDIHVTMQRLDWPQYYNKLFVAGLGERAPEVFVVHASSVERFHEANLLRPLDDLARGADGIDVADFEPNILDSSVRDGRIVGIPLDCHMMGMYYNKALFREAGIVDENGEARPPRTREEFLDAAKRITRDKDGDGKPEQWGFAYSWLRTNGLTAIGQNGGRFLSEDGTSAEMDGPGNVAGLAFLASLAGEHKVAQPPYNDSFASFRQGRVGMIFEGIYMLADLKKHEDLDFGAAPVPACGQRDSVWGDSHVMCMAQDLDDEHRDAAWTFMKYLSDNSLDWAACGQVPVRKSLLESERFAAMEEQRNFARQLPYVAYVPRIPYIFEFLAIHDLSVEQTARGTLKPEDALAAADRDLEAVIARYAERARYRREGGAQP